MRKDAESFLKRGTVQGGDSGVVGLERAERRKGSWEEV